MRLMTRAMATLPASSCGNCLCNNCWSCRPVLLVVVVSFAGFQWGMIELCRPRGRARLSPMGQIGTKRSTTRMGKQEMQRDFPPQVLTHHFMRSFLRRSQCTTELG